MLGIKVSYPVSTFTRTLLPLADAAAHRTALDAQQLAPYLTSLSGLGTATGLVRKGAGNSASVQPTSLVVDTFLGAASQEEALTILGLVPGTDIQPYNAELAAIAALTTTTFGRSLLTQNDAAAARTTLSAAATSHTQDWSTITNSPTNLSGYGITDAQPLDSDLTALAALTTTGLIDRTGSGTAVTRITGATGLDLLAAANAAAARTTLEITMGTWTPSYTFSTSGSVSYSQQAGQYLLIGDVVFFTANLLTASLSSPTGSVGVTLPFTPDVTLVHSVSVYSSSWGASLASSIITGVILSTGVALRKNFAGQNFTDVVATDMSGITNNTIRISGYYTRAV